MGAPACGKLKLTGSDAATWDVLKSGLPQVYNHSRAGVVSFRTFSNLEMLRSLGGGRYRKDQGRSIEREKENGSLFRT